MYGTKTDLSVIMGDYPYFKYDWDILLQIVWTFQNFNKKLKEFKNAEVKNVELICFEDCSCCLNLKNNKISINNIPELPMPSCPLNNRLCLSARYNPIIELKNKGVEK